MGAENYRKSGQIPAFGDWDSVNDMPITQYFDCARQAGLLRCSCSGECGGAYLNNVNAAAYWGAAAGGAAADRYGVVYEKPLPHRLYAVPDRKQTRGVNKGYYPHLNEQRKQVKVSELKTQPRNQTTAHKHHHHPKQQQISSTKSANLVHHKTSISAKPVDEDLYKIPPELLENSKRKRMLGFFSKCMVPPCAA